MKHQVIIRAATEHDANSVFMMARDLATSFIVDEDRFHASFNKILTMQRHAVLVAESDETLVGYALGFCNLSFYGNGNVAWLEEIYVLPEYRKAGVGRSLMANYELWAKQNECAVIALATRRAETFYLSLGYEASATYFRKIPS